MTTTDRAALLRAVLEEPADDLHRLAYADLCEETGDSQRAAFIRCQIAGEKVKIGTLLFKKWFMPDMGSAITLSHSRGVTRMRFAYGATGLPADAPLVVVHRGFIERLEIDTADFLRHAEALFRHHPITEVRLTDRRPERWVAANLPGDCYGRWFWYLRESDQGTASHHWLPQQLRFNEEWLQAKWYMDTPTYDTQDAALAALSRACVAHGRKLAGLPALDREDSR